MIFFLVEDTARRVVEIIRGGAEIIDCFDALLVQDNLSFFLWPEKSSQK